MSKKPAERLIGLGKVRLRNTKIDHEIVVAHEKLERDLKKLGVEIRPHYNVEPPLGSNRTGCYTTND